ncbi:hypothetical protein KEM54_001341, partial [Ascosphaera aggregata]
MLTSDGNQVEKPKARVNAKATASPTMATPTQSYRCRCLRWTIGFVLRLAIWYTIIASLLYCPSHSDSSPELSETKSKLCRPYFRVRSYLHPHVSSYYDQYATPYIEIAQPYAEKLHDTVYLPVVEYTQDKYYKHGDQHVQKVISYAKNEWDRRAGPKVREVADTMRSKYVTVVEPSAQQVIVASAPYHKAALSFKEKARYHANYIYSFYVDKYHQFLEAYVEHGLTKGHEVAVLVMDKALPYSKQAVSATVNVWADTVRPRIKDLYSQNIEPQLLRISRKLATYREARTQQADITSTRVVGSKTAEITQSSTSHVSSYSTQPSSHQSSLHTSSQQPIVHVHRKVADDLTDWETKFASAVDKGSAELLKTISTIIEQKHSTKPIEHARDLLRTLQEEIASQLDSLKASVLDIIASLPVNTTEKDQYAALVRLQEKTITVRENMKDAAQALRSFVREFDQSIMNEVLTVTNNTLDVLSNIQVLGVEQIGMRWAWMDNVSYEDWAKYSALKKQEPVWKDELRNIAILHDGLIMIRREASDALSQGVTLAEKTAVELNELYEIGRWKILAEDGSETFEMRDESPAAVRAERRKELGLDQEEINADADVESPQKVEGVVPSQAAEEEEPIEVIGEGEEVTAESSSNATPSSGSSSDTAENTEDLLADPWEPTADSSWTAVPTTASTAPSSVWGGAAAAEFDPNLVASSHAQTANDEEESSANIDSVLDAEKSRDFHDFIEQSPNPATTSSSTISDDSMALQASAQLGAALLRATETLSSAIAQATGEEAVIIDAKRRYYEAIGVAHD